MVIWQIILWLSIAGLLHTYLFYPLFLHLRARNKSFSHSVFENSDDLPPISIVMAAYNEEKVIQEKIESVFNSGYPMGKIEFLIGSDASTDNTNQIIDDLKLKYPQLQLINFPGRTGKIGIINALVPKTKNEILILTDANVLFSEDTIFHLVKHFREEKIVLVGANILNEKVRADGISIQEKSYLQNENLLKYYEGVLWGCMIGAFGGCFAMRKSWFKPVPSKFIVDDFYTTMDVLEKGGKAINEPAAICYEDVSNRIKEEFRRKIRISAGNFQNLKRFKRVLTSGNNGLAFAFFSHKILRWLGPFLILIAFLTNYLLLGEGEIYRILFSLQLALLLLPVVDTMLRLIKVNLLMFRFVTHFYLMNLALFIGFLKFVYGVESSIWKPTQRHQ